MYAEAVCVIRTTVFTEERKRKTEIERRDCGVVVLNGSQTNVQNSGIAARPREDEIERKRSEHTSF